MGRKNFVAALDVKLAEISGRKPGRQPKRDDAARGGAGDEIKVSGNRVPAQVSFLQSRQDSGGKDPADAAAINGQDAKVPIFIPMEWNAACSARSGGSGFGARVIGHASFR